ncbi:hypothetical protein RRG08_029211 [Elysia crispata]|uniref:Uncharacterized protein n=1 Tax=Elysia crispata TaxID=231223 RepID=A0AAE1DZH8_9GAST|nr:hypothetical protein RRG08_029211 [Elysia crispata]
MRYPVRMCVQDTCVSSGSTEESVSRSARCRVIPSPRLPVPAREEFRRCLVPKSKRPAESNQVIDEENNPPRQVNENVIVNKDKRKVKKCNSIRFSVSVMTRTGGKTGHTSPPRNKSPSTGLSSRLAIVSEDRRLPYLDGTRCECSVFCADVLRKGVFDLFGVNFQPIMFTQDFPPSGQRVFALQDAVAIVMLNLKHLSRSDEILGKHDYALTGLNILPSLHRRVITEDDRLFLTGESQEMVSGAEDLGLGQLVEEMVDVRTSGLSAGV